MSRTNALAVVVFGIACGCQAPTPSFEGDTLPTVGVARAALGSQPGDGPGGAHIIYLNYTGDGTTLYPMTGWDEDSATNHSQILRTGVNTNIAMPKFDPSPYTTQMTAQQAMDAITNKMKQFYAPFNAQIVTTRPAAGLKYTMCVVGGLPSDVLGGGSSGAAGIAPLDCSLGTSQVGYNLNEANITFAFSAGLAPDRTNFSPSEALTQIAITAAQETAHGFGLEHTLNNKDVMYPQLDYRQTGFGGSAQLQVTPSECDNKSTTQDSAGKLTMVIGAAGSAPAPGTVTPTPKVSFIAPKPGETVPRKFDFLVDASESGGTIDHVEIMAAMQDLGALMTAPYRSTLSTQTDGSVDLTAIAYDTNGNSSQTTVSFKVSATAAPQVVGCGLDLDCPSGQTCNSGTCGTGGSMMPPPMMTPDAGSTGPNPGLSPDGGTIPTGTGNPGSGPTCSGCPSGYICTSDGNCEPASGNAPGLTPGKGTLGSTCSDTEPCLGSALCLPYGNHNICTTQCQPSDPNACGSRMVCASVGARGRVVGLDGAHRTRARRSPAHARLIRFALPLLLLLSGCAGEAGRLRFVSSHPSGAAWSFVVDDRARGAQLLIDGRFRYEGCNRAGRELRCELRGLWPGGHSVELRLPGAVLRRSVVLGRPWPTRPMLVRVADVRSAVAAAEAGADGVIVDGTRAQPGHAAPAELAEIVEAAHGKGVRVAARGPADLVETAGVDALVDAPLPSDLQARFPEARALTVDAAASAAADAFTSGTMPPRIWEAKGLVAAHGLLGGGLALLAPAGAIVDSAAFALLDARRRHAALRTGGSEMMTAEPSHLGARLTAGDDRVLLLINADTTPWIVGVEIEDALDLLGTRIEEGKFAAVAPRDVALVIRNPQPEKTRY
jgi:hypothetical protein